MDNILDSAESSLAGLVGQREQLKGVKQKMLNIANQLGMSQTVIRLIGKRADQVLFRLRKKQF
jgi:predicted DNA-binding ArsR family transcriptional regulator